MNENNGLPTVPVPPDGVPLMEHVPTIIARVHYWETYGRARHDPVAKSIAMILRNIYENALRELDQTKSGEANPIIPVRRRSRSVAK
jgi:hypothetical protein